MTRNKTIDGIRLNDILRIVGDAGIGFRTGNSHPYLLTCEGLRPCPLASSTHAERMVAPWLAQATGKSKQEAYEALRRGYW